MFLQQLSIGLSIIQPLADPFQERNLMTSNNINTLDVHELKRRRDAQPDLCLIDVREPDEWHDKHIPNTLHIPKDTIISTIDSHDIDRETPIYLFCRGGTRSLYAAQALLSLGYKEVYSIDGGITAWEAAGYPCVFPAIS